jgi:putative heme-binding domain-containing protein
MATHELVDRYPSQAGSRTKDLLAANKLGAVQRAHAAYVLARLGEPESITPLCWDEEWKVRVHAVRALAGMKVGDSGLPIHKSVVEQIVRLLYDQNPMVVRATAECFGGIDRACVLPLTLARRSAAAGDVQLIHAVRIGMRDCFAKPGAFGAGPVAWRTSDATHSAHMADISLGIPSRDSAAFVLWYLQETEPRPSRFGEMLGHAVRQLPAERLPEALKLVKDLRGEPAMRQQAAVLAVHQALQSRGQQSPEELVAVANDVATKLLSSGRQRQIVQGVNLAREMKLSAVRTQLEAIATGGEPPAIRPAAIDACVACDPAGSVPMLARLTGSAPEPMAIRQKAAQALGAINNAAAHRELVTLFASAPAQLEADIAAGLATSAAAAEMLVEAIERGKASAQVLRNRQVAERLKQIDGRALRERIAKLSAALPHIDPRVQTLITSRIAGFGQAKPDAAAGKQVFAKTCGVCHKLGGEGTKIGPDLDGIGNRGVARLVEDVLDPSRNVDQAFRTTLVTTDDGQSLGGLALREEGQVLVLADNQGKEVRVRLDDILERSVSSLSPMPANVAEQLGEVEFYQLLAFLLKQHGASK